VIEAVRNELMEALPNEVIASAIKKLDTERGARGAGVCARLS